MQLKNINPILLSMILCPLIWIHNAYADTWHSFNDGINAGKIYQFKINPSKPNEVFAFAQLGGIYKTDNQANAWTMMAPDIFSGKLLQNMLINPQHSEEFYVTEQRKGILKTSDDGKTWKVMSDGIVIGDWINRVYLLAINPENPQELYASTPEHLYKTTNGGVLWKKVNVIAADFPKKDSYYASELTYNTVNSNIMILTMLSSEDRKILRSQDGGQTWTIPPSLNTGVTDLKYIRSGVLYGLTSNTLYKSNDNGNTWSSIPLPATKKGTAFFEVNETNPQEIYVAPASEKDGVFKTMDEGKTWKKIFQDTSSELHPYPYSILLNQSNPNELYLGGYNTPIHYSNDAGKTWVLSQNGLKNFAVYTIATDPKDTKTIYAGTNAGLWMTRNGEHWESVKLFEKSQVNKIVIDQQHPENIFIALDVTGQQLPSEIYYSSDYGKTWEPAHFTGRGPWTTISLAINPLNAKQMFACSWADEVYRSDDGGRNWATQSGIDAKYDIAFNPKDSKEIYAVGQHGVNKSNDGGKTWAQIAFDFGNMAMFQVAIDPNNPQTVYVAGAKDLLFKSADGGSHWILSNEGLPSKDIARSESIMSLIIDPNDTQTLYAATGGEEYPASGHGVFVSHDGGAHWATMNDGLNNPIAISLALDNQRNLMVGTNGSGMYKLNR